MDKQDLEEPLDLAVEFLNIWDQQVEQALTLVNEGKANYWHLDWDRNYEQELHFKDDSNCFIKLGFLLQPDLEISYFGGLSQHLVIDLPLILKVSKRVIGNELSLSATTQYWASSKNSKFRQKKLI